MVCTRKASAWKLETSELQVSGITDHAKLHSEIPITRKQQQQQNNQKSVCD